MPKSNIITDTTIFTGCDSKYWNKFGISFVKSFKFYNPASTVHIHLFNPTDADLIAIDSLPCNYSYEYIDDSFVCELVDNAKRYLNNELDDPEYRSAIKHGLKFCHQDSLDERLKYLMTFSVFASFRFIRLAEMWDGVNPIAAYDTDTVCKGAIVVNEMLTDADGGCYSHKGTRFVVSLVAFKNNSSFIKAWAGLLQDRFNKKTVYGFLDQDTLVSLSNTQRLDKISGKFCDPGKKSNSSIVITGKGNTKESEIFIQEQNKWK